MRGVPLSVCLTTFPAAVHQTDNKCKRDRTCVREKERESAGKKRKEKKRQTGVQGSKRKPPALVPLRPSQGWPAALLGHRPGSGRARPLGSLVSRHAAGEGGVVEVEVGER